MDQEEKTVKKKSKWNRMIYLAVIFALLLLLYLFLKNRNEKAEEAESGGAVLQSE